MLGKTNLLFVAEDEAAELAFKPEYILTSSSGNILKIEYINNLYFVFTSDNKVLYGSDINSLQTLKKDGMNVRVVNHSGESEFVPAEETHTCYIRFEKNTTINKLMFYPMVSEEGGEYEPYKESSFTITTENGLPGIPVESGGNYTDSNGQQWICDEVLKYADGSGEKIQRVGIIDSYSAEAITGVYMSTTGELTEGAKILYQLTEVIRTPLTEEQLAEIEKLSTFYSVTNISNDFDCGMRITYLADSKNYINRKVTEQVASIVENIK